MFKKMEKTDALCLFVVSNENYAKQMIHDWKKLTGYIEEYGWGEVPPVFIEALWTWTKGLNDYPEIQKFIKDWEDA